VKRLPRKTKEDEVPIGEEDEPDPADAEPDTEEEEDAPAPVAPTRNEDKEAYWKKKFYDMTQQNSNMASEYRAKINKLQDEVRQAEMKNWDKDDKSGTGTEQYGSPPQNKFRDTDEVPPFILLKTAEAMTATGQKILVPRVVPNFSMETVPRLEDIPEALLLKWGGGEYKIRDGRNKIVGSILVATTTQDNTPSPSAMMGGLGAYMVDPVQRAMNLFEHAKKTNDEKLAAMAAAAIQRELDRGTAPPNQQSDLNTALATITALFGAMNQAQATFRATGFGAGAAEPEAVTLKRLDLELAEKRSKGLTELGTSMVKEAQNIVPQIAAIFKKPEISAVDVERAATRLGRESTQAPRMPAQTPRNLNTPQGTRPPPSMAGSPPAPPQNGPRAPPGTKVTCGGCGSPFTIDGMIEHIQTSACGQTGGAPAAPANRSPKLPKELLPVNLPEDVKAYLGYMKTLSTYIVSWTDGDRDASPEQIAGAVWLGTMGNQTQRDKLLSLAEEGYDAVVKSPELNEVISKLNKFPEFNEVETSAFLNVALEAKILTPADIASATDLSDLSPAVDEFMNHITIQKSVKGREWFCRLLNAIALKGGKPAPHAEFLPGGQQREVAGRDNL
jgi:hypothetical protein